MRVIWAVSFLKERWTELQWKMFFASVRSCKQYHPNVTTVLYGSNGVIIELEKYNRINLWDEVYEDTDSYVGGYSEVFWDYPKVEALYREKEKVVYVDYDILFRGEVLNNLDPKFNWFWCKESTNFPFYYKKSEKILGLPPGIREKVYHSDIAYNTGILYVDKQYLTRWREIYQSVMPAAARYVGTDSTMKLALTVGQSNIVGIVPKETVKFISDSFFGSVCHFLGRSKNDPRTQEYKEYNHIIDTLYPDFDFQQKYRKKHIL